MLSSGRRISDSSQILRLTSLMVTLALASGCTSMMVPYLDPKPLNDAATCTGTQGGPGKACGVVERFIQTRDAVKKVQTEAHDSYVDRARINSISSALAFPLAGWALYRGVHPNGDSAQNQLLKWGLVVGAGYEVKNTLMSNSPESVYMLSEARLSCVLDEAARYRLDLPASTDDCATKATTLESKARGLDAMLLTLPDQEAGLKAEGQALVSKANTAVTQYSNAEVTLQLAADQMQSATRKIVVDTNNALKSPNISFHQATTLMSSEVAAFKPASTSANTDGAKDASDKTGPIKMEMKALVVGINKFAQVCVRSQPPTPAFTSCTTYSPAAPPASTIVTTLSSDSVSMEVGSKLSFIVTSSPSGTPWAEFHDQAAAAALATPQLVTLDPNRTQVTLSYVNAVKAETKVTLNLTTLGVPNNPKTIEITLKTVPAPTPAAVQVAVAAPAAVPPGGIIKVPEAEWSKLVKDKPELIKKLQLNNPTTADLIAQLNTKWRGLCGEDNKDENKLLRNEFLVEILADHQQSTPVSSYCKN